MSSSILSGRFYTDNDHELIVCGNSGEGFSVESGVRQGCPLSMLIFTLALDPLIRALTSQLEPAEVLIRTFADDIAIVAEDLDTIFREGDNTGKRVADVLEETFSMWEGISGLNVKTKTCICIPCGGPFLRGPFSKRNDPMIISYV